MFRTSVFADAAVPDCAVFSRGKDAMDQALFRQEVLDRQTERLHGALLLSQPLPHLLLTLFIAGLVVAASVFLVRHDYVRKQSVQGLLVPDRGLLELRAPAAGSLAAVHVAADGYVEAGAPLFTVRFDQTLAADGAVSEQLLDETRVQEATLHEQMDELDLLLGNERRLLALRVAALERAGNLRDRSLLAAADYDAVYAQWLQQQNALGRLSLQQAELRSQAAELQKQQVRMAAEQDTTVLAPAAGSIATVLGRGGMSVAAGEPVVTLLPEGAVLEAELWLPGSASGFVRPGQGVNLRIDAFPYQKFGVQRAHIVEIAGSAGPARNGVPPLFRARAALERQDILAFGMPQPLRAGMTFTADIVVDKRSLLEWLLEPLFSIRGKLDRGGSE
jgi:membrane fusion protein